MVTRSILGPDGQPVRMGDLAEPQTQRIAQLRHEFQGHPSRGLTPSRLAAILDAAEQGDLVAQYELYEDMEEKDGHIASEMGKRRRAPLLLDWDIVPPSNPKASEKRAANQLKELVQQLDDFEDIIFDATDAIGKGYACLEIEWHRVDGFWLPKSVTHRPQTWFQIDRGFRQEIRLRDATPTGAQLQPFGWIVHTHKAKSGYLERAGLFRALVWPYLFKNYSVADLAEFLEIYGIPVRVGKYPAGASEKDKLTLLRALASIGHNAAGIVPDGMVLDFMDAATGDPQAFELMISWCERTQSKVILGGTLTSQADGKSSTNALGNVHNEIRKDLRDGDAKQVARTLTRDLLYPIAALNGLAEGIRRSPSLRFNVNEPEDIRVYAAALPRLAATGMRISRQWAQEKLGIPEPESDEDVLVAPKVLPTDPPEPGARAAASRQLGKPASASSLDHLAAILEREVDPVMTQWVDELRELVEHAGSLDEIRDGLLSRFNDMPVDALAELMALALAGGELAGRGEVLADVDRG